jgi:CheY-like chemotaxis protein
VDEKKSTTGDSAIKCPRPASAPLRILAVDDDEVNLRLIRRMLEKLGHSVTPVAGGPEGLKLFREETFDLVVTDLTMPEMSGHEIAAEMKALNPKIPIIMLTGYSDMMDSGGEKPESVDHVVGKPISMEGISRAIALVVFKA